MLFKGFPDDRHWLTYSQVENEEVFIKWCDGGHRPYTIGWISAKAKEVHAELIKELNAKEKLRIQAEKAEKMKNQVSLNLESEKAVEASGTDVRKSNKTKKVKTK